MTKTYKNKYRSESTRLQSWDYGSNGSYFITICTKNRSNFFGEIENDEMILNEIGELAHRFWAEIPKHFPFIDLKNFIIMPNHTHGILNINKSDGNDDIDINNRNNNNNNNNPGKSRFQNQGKNTISSIIGSFKSITTKHARKINPDFAWQPLFHDHIIRNQKSFNRIQDYILNNPKNWKKD